MIAEICDYLKNYFDRDMPKYFGEIKIENGQLVGFFNRLAENQYFRIVGSKFNDGIYKYPETELTDETFSGAVWAMAIPKDFLKIVEEIKRRKNSNVTVSERVAFWCIQLFKG